MFEFIRQLFGKEKENNARAAVDAAWVKKQIYQINRLKPAPERPESDKKPIQYQPKVSENCGSNASAKSSAYAIKMLPDWEKTVRKENFSELLMVMIAEKNMKYKEFYKAAHIDRRVFSTIKNQPSYQPSKETAVLCCFGLELSTDEAERLLAAGGYTLSMSIAWDRAVFYCIANNIYDLFVVNEILYAMNERCFDLT